MAISRQADGRTGLVGEMGHIASDGENAFPTPPRAAFPKILVLGPNGAFGPALL